MRDSLCSLGAGVTRIRCRLDSNGLGFCSTQKAVALLPIWSSKLRARRGAKQPKEAPPHTCEADLFLINKCCEKKTNSPRWGWQERKTELFVIQKQSAAKHPQKRRHTRARRKLASAQIFMVVQASGKLQAWSIKNSHERRSLCPDRLNAHLRQNNWVQKIKEKVRALNWPKEDSLCSTHPFSPKSQQSHATWAQRNGRGGALWLFLTEIPHART